MIKGKVSLIVASYNHSGYLRERMESLINQTWEDIEIIVIDDCSTDNSVEVLREYANHPKVTLIENKKNTGWVKVSNQGLSMATGEYVIFENCDDFCNSRQIESLVEAFKSHPSAGIAFCKSLMVDEHSVVYGDDFHIREQAFKEHVSKSDFFTGHEMSKFLFHSCVLPNLSAVLFRKEDIDKVGGFSTEFLVCADWELFFKIAETKDFAYVSEALNSFRQHRTTIRKSTKEKIVYDEYFRLLSRYIKKTPLTVVEKVAYFLWVSRLWVKHLFSPSGNGVANFKTHMTKNISYSLWIIFLLPLAIVVEVPSALIRKMRSKSAVSV